MVSCEVLKVVLGGISATLTWYHDCLLFGWWDDL